MPAKVTPLFRVAQEGVSVGQRANGVPQSGGRAASSRCSGVRAPALAAILGIGAELAASRSRITRVYIGVAADQFVNNAPGQTSVDPVGVTRYGMYMLIEAKGDNIEHGLE